MMSQGLNEVTKNRQGSLSGGTELPVLNSAMEAIDQRSGLGSIAEKTEPTQRVIPDRKQIMGCHWWAGMEVRIRGKKGETKRRGQSRAIGRYLRHLEYEVQLRAAATILSYLVVIFRPEDGCHIPSIASNRTCLRAVGRLDSKGCCYRGSLILGIMHVYLTAHMREGISARPGVTGGVTGSGGTSNKGWPATDPARDSASVNNRTLDLVAALAVYRIGPQGWRPQARTPTRPRSSPLRA